MFSKLSFFKKYLLFGSAIWILGCAGGIQPYPLFVGENIVLEFEGPVSLTYTPVNGTAKTVSLDDGATLEFRNLFDDGSSGSQTFYETTLLYFRLNDNGGSLYLGPDPEVKNFNSDTLLFADPSAITAYKTDAKFNLNVNGSDTSNLDSNAPVTFQGKFLGAEANRFVFLCQDDQGVIQQTIEINSLTPSNYSNTQCPANTKGAFSLKTSSKHYSKDEIINLTQSSHGSVLTAYSLETITPGIRSSIFFKIKNTQAQANTSPTSSLPQGGPNQATGPVTPSGMDQSPVGGGGGCVISDSSNPSPSMAWMWLVVLGGTAVAAGRKSR